MENKQMALFLDIDGTLILRDKEPFDEDVEQIKIAKEYGHRIFLNTGRAYSNIPAVLREADYIDGMVLGSGTHVQLNGRTIYHQWIPEQALVSICEYYLGSKKWCVFEGETNLYSINEIDQYLFAEEVYPVKDKNDFIDKYRGVKITKLTIEGEITAGENAVLQNGFQLNSFPGYFEGIIRGEDKSKGMGIMLKETGISPENTLAIGDSVNDIAAIRFAKLGIAMGNACDELKQAACDITADCEHGGVGKAIKKWVLNPRD